MEKGESRIIIPGFRLWEMTGSRTGRGFQRSRGAGRAAGHDAPRLDLGIDFRATRGGYARGVQGARRGNGAVSVEGCGRRGKRDRNGARKDGLCANVVNRGGDFDEVKFCTRRGPVSGLDCSVARSEFCRGRSVRAAAPARSAGNNACAPRTNREQRARPTQ
jgi:hypothetical protein